MRLDVSTGLRVGVSQHSYRCGLPRRWRTEKLAVCENSHGPSAFAFQGLRVRSRTRRFGQTARRRWGHGGSCLDGWFERASRTVW
jgi:hypothetical protein